MKNEIEIKNKYNGLVYYANILARKCSKFTLEEQKVLHLIFAQINPYEKNQTTFKLSKLDFFDKLELESTDRYPRYRKLVGGLIDKSFFEVKEDNGDETIGVVITGSKWHAKQPYFEVKLNRWFMPYLEQLIRDYTKVNLESILKLKSKHALSLYKFLCSWTDEKKAQNKRYLTTKELKELFGLSIDDYVFKGKFNRADFERKNIKPSIVEINSKTNFDVSFKKNKKNNRVQSYEFTWTQKNKPITKNQKKQLTIFDTEKETNKWTQIANNNILFGDDNDDIVWDEDILNNAKKIKVECNIVHKNMYEENDCKKIHIFK